MSTSKVRSFLSGLSGGRFSRDTKELTSAHNLLRVASLVSLALFSAVVSGAIPFLTMPTLGQALWALGFAESMANSFPPSLYATNFGNPDPAPIAFGLSAVFPMAVLTSFGTAPSVAYSSVFAIYLIISALGAYGFFRLLSRSHWIALLLAAIWVASPMVVQHQGYSMLSLGIALIPTYLLAYNFFFREHRGAGLKTLAVAGLFGAALVSVFMDGYTFVMFASAVVVWAFTRALRTKNYKALIYELLVVGLAFGVSYFLYFLYIGRSSYPSSPVNFFRGWGVDLFYLLSPTQGAHFVPDLLQLSVPRSGTDHFGDGSSWVTTYLFPILVLIVFVVATAKQKNLLRVALPLALVSSFALWMSLGPSLKFNSQRPAGVETQLMEAKYALFPTGNELVSTLPGFENMRASYRWVALGSVGMLGVVAVSTTLLTPRQRKMLGAIGLTALLVYLPNPVNQAKAKRAHYVQALQIESQLVTDLKIDLRGQTGVLFLPVGNDFFTNYLSSRADFYTFNIGGDKNLAMASEGWPINFLKLNAESDKYPSDYLFALGVRYVVVPHLDLLSSAHSWPCGSSASPTCTEDFEINNMSSFEPLIRELGVPFAKRQFYTLYKVYPSLPVSSYPYAVDEDPRGFTSLLGPGWHDIESSLVWSTEQALIRLPIPDECLARDCLVSIGFSVFGASPERPVTVNFTTTGSTNPRAGSTTQLISPDISSQELLISGKGVAEILISVPQATSPERLGVSGDSRTLGIALWTVDISIPVSTD